MPLLVYVFPLAFIAIFGLFLALFITRIRYTPGARPLVVLIVAASLWSAGYALEFYSPELGMKIFWAKFQYFGIMSIPLAWLYLSYHYQGSSQGLRKLWKFWALSGVIPALTILLVWTNEYHRLVWQTIHLEAIGPVQILDLDHGPWFYICWIYSYILMLVGSIRLGKTLLGAVRLYSWQIKLALIAIVIPWLGNLIYVTGLSPIKYLDWTPFAFIIAGLFLTIGLFRYQLTNILPIAHHQVFDSQIDQLLVLDIHDYIVDLNPAAQKIAAISGDQPIGKPLARVFPDLAPLVEQASRAEEFHIETALGEEPNRRFYDLYTSPITEKNQALIGCLVVLHDITQLKQAQARLEQSRTQLEQVVLERTAELRKTVQQLESELIQRTLAEKRLEDVLESAPDAMLLVDRSGAIKLINAQGEKLFGYRREEILGQPINCMIPLPLREQHQRYEKDFFMNPTVRRIETSLDVTARRKDGSQFPAEISLGPMDTEEGFWAACSVRDITDRKRAEEEQGQLLEEIKQSREELSTLTIRLQEVQELERRQIASQLHDRIGQNLTGLNLNLQIIENQLDPDSNAALRNRLDDSLTLVEETTQQVRDVMADLHPPVLDDYGLVSALQWYLGDYSQRTGISVHVIGTEFNPRLPANVEMVLFRLVQEALNNAAKHARATQVDIVVESTQEIASLVVKDNGCGFNPETLKIATEQTHWGLINMRQRAASIGAQLLIDSAPGGGTQVCIYIGRRSHDD